MVTGVGSMLIVGLAALAASVIRSPAWQRTVWRAAMASLAFFILVEWIGVSTRAASLVRFRFLAQSAAVQTEEAFGWDPLLSEPQEAFLAPEVWAAVGGPASDKWEADSENLAPPVAPAGDSYAALPDAPEAPASLVAMRQAQATEVWWPARVWGHGMMLCAFWVAWTRWRLRRLRQRRAVGAGDLRWQRVRALADRLGFRRGITLLEVPGLDSPVAFGVFRPTVAVPDDFAEEGLQREHESVLAHEVAHLASGDPLWQVIADLVCAAWWWQPLAWWARRRLRSASEAAADEASILVPGGPQALAASLVALGRRLVVERSFGWLAFHGYGFRSALGRRVHRLLNLASREPRLPPRSYLRVANTALCVLLIAVAVLGAAWAEPGVSPRSSASDAGVSGRWWESSLAAMTLTSWLGTAAPKEVAPPSKPPEAPAAKAEQRSAPAVPVPPLEPAERERLERRLHDLEARQYQLRTEGKYEESIPVGREIRVVRQRLGLALPPTASVSRESATREERELRAKYLRSAARLLRAAGDEWEWDAQRMVQIADRLTRDGGTAPTKSPAARGGATSNRAGAAPRPSGRLGGLDLPLDSPAHAPGGAFRVSPPAGSQVPAELIATMRSLSQEVQEMRKDLAEMREQLKRATGEKASPSK